KILIAALLVVPAWTQDAPEYIDTFKVKVRPDKLAEYEKNVRKLADANRKNGDRWIAYSTEYGEGGKIYFSPLPRNLAEVELGMNAFNAALKEAYGPAGQKLMYDIIAGSQDATSELRQRRFDLSVNVPSTPEERLKMLAGTRFFRTVRV